MLDGKPPATHIRCRMRFDTAILFLFGCLVRKSHQWCERLWAGICIRTEFSQSSISALSSSDYLENDLVAVAREGKSPRLCAVKPDGSVLPLCIKEDDVETDLFADPREMFNTFWQNIDDEMVAGRFGEGFYGQRPVPSLGGGPGYGAEADELWSVTEEQLEQVRGEGVDIPVLDVGIAHGEKARGGALS